MNKYRKRTSREIRDIMRSDKWGRMSYKEARRKWKNGIRAFRVGDRLVWKAADLGRLGFSRARMRELGQAYSKIEQFCIVNGVKLDCYAERETPVYCLEFRFTDQDTGARYKYVHAIDLTVMTRSSCPLIYLAEYIIGDFKDELERLGVKHTVKLDPWSMWPPVLIAPFDCVVEEPREWLKVAIPCT